MDENEAKKTLENIIEVQCKEFWLWCFLRETEIKQLTGYYNINQRIDKIWKLYKKHQDEQEKG